jgi:hypothetical protein
MLALGSGHGAPRDFAMGISLGSPMGISVLQNLDDNEAIQGALEINIENPFVVHGDYVFKEDAPFPFEEQYGKLWLYYGPGVRFEWGDRDLTVAGPYRHAEGGRFALRFPAGLQYYVPKVPFDVFAELAPMLGLWRSTNVDLTWALGLRFNL